MEVCISTFGLGIQENKNVLLSIDLCKSRKGNIRLLKHTYQKVIINSFLYL